MDPRPPVRAPQYFDDNDGPPTLGSAQWLLTVLCDFARRSPVWRDRAGRDVAVKVEGETPQDAIITFSGAISGRIELSIAPSVWVRADVYLDDAWFARGWIERCYEECEIWPDASDGLVGPLVSDDPPGRISKRGYWLQFDTSQWLGYESTVRMIGFEIPEIT